MAIQNYRDLIGWRLSVDLAADIYELTKSFPRDEIFGLTAQLRRAAVSIAANIAEGQGRIHRGDFVHHLSFAKGSLAETERHLIIPSRIGLISEGALAQLDARRGEIGRVFNGLVRALEQQ